MVGSIALGLSRRERKCAFDAEMKPVDCKTAHEEASEVQKVIFGSHKGALFASRNYPQSPGTAPLFYERHLLADTSNNAQMIQSLCAIDFFSHVLPPLKAQFFQEDNTILSHTLLKGAECRM